MAFYTRNPKTLATYDAVVPSGKLGSVSGVVFDDLNGDGTQDPGEAGLKNRFVFLDANRNGVLDEGEPFARTKADGAYTIKKVMAGDYDIVETVPKGWHATYPFVEGDTYAAAAAKYKFVDVSKINGPMAVSDPDDGYGFLEAANGFTFYGENHIDIAISVNGFLTLVSSPTDRAFVNTALPDPTAPSNLIAPLWDDYVLGDTGAIYTFDDDQNGRVIIEWKDVTRFGDTSGDTSTFEAILYDDGSIKFMYKEVAPNGSATVGVQNDVGTVGTQISYDQPVEALTGYLLTPHDILYGRTTVHVDPGAVLTGIDFGQTRTVNAPALHDFDLGQHAPTIAHAHDLALA